MRLDKYLKVSRIIKRRPVAKSLAENSRIKVNNKVVKPSYEVQVGDTIQIDFEHRVIICKVTDLDKRLWNKDGVMYEMITNEYKND